MSHKAWVVSCEGRTPYKCSTRVRTHTYTRTDIAVWLHAKWEEERVSERERERERECVGGGAWRNSKRNQAFGYSLHAPFILPSRFSWQNRSILNFWSSVYTITAADVVITLQRPTAFCKYLPRFLAVKTESVLVNVLMHCGKCWWWWR